jgi:hypothetical protein
MRAQLESQITPQPAREHLPLKVTWNATTDAGTWVIINRPTGEVIGAVQVDGRSPQPGEPIRRYQVFGDQIGVPPASGTLSASVVDDAQVLAAWNSTLSSAA